MDVAGVALWCAQVRAGICFYYPETLPGGGLTNGNPVSSCSSTSHNFIKEVFSMLWAAAITAILLRLSRVCFLWVLVLAFHGMSHLVKSLPFFSLPSLLSISSSYFFSYFLSSSPSTPFPPSLSVISSSLYFSSSSFPFLDPSLVPLPLFSAFLFLCWKGAYDVFS